MTEQEPIDEELEILGRELRRIPTPLPPSALVSRVRRLAHLELASRAEERFKWRVMVFLLFFSWAASISFFLAVRLLAPSWSTAYFASSWIAAAAVWVLLAFHVRRGRAFA